jgi:hypothetical protein
MNANNNNDNVKGSGKGRQLSRFVVGCLLPMVADDDWLW